jgi:hypothetical protein
MALEAQEPVQTPLQAAEVSSDETREASSETHAPLEVDEHSLEPFEATALAPAVTDTEEESTRATASAELVSTEDASPMPSQTRLSAEAANAEDAPQSPQEISSQTEVDISENADISAPQAPLQVPSELEAASGLKEAGTSGIEEPSQVSPTPESEKPAGDQETPSASTAEPASLEAVEQLPFPEFPTSSETPLHADTDTLEAVEQLPFPELAESLEAPLPPRTASTETAEQLPASPETPLLAEADTPEVAEQLPFPEFATIVETPSPDESSSPETADELPENGETPSSTKTASPEPVEQLPFPELSESLKAAPRAAEPASVGETHTPPPAGSPPIEEAKTPDAEGSPQALTSTGEQPLKTPARATTENSKEKPEPSVAARPAAQSQAEIVESPDSPRPSSPAKPAGSREDEIDEQDTIIVRAIPKTALPQSGGQSRPPIQQRDAAWQARTDFYADSPTINYRGNLQNTNTLPRVRPLPSAPLPKPAPKPVRTIGGLLWSLIAPIFKRARDPEPERPKEPVSPSSSLGWLPVFALSSAFGLFTTSTAFNAARANSPLAELYYWLGIGIIYLPIVVRLIMPYASRAERFGLLCIAAICLFLTKVSLSPLYYSGYDEFLHWRTINDILSTGHLLTKNALLPVSPFYPGLEIVTSALSNISGMTSIQAGFTVIGFACALMVLSIFLLAELLSGSARLASIAAVIYMANPHFLFFDTQFAYESLALPLATVVMVAMVRYETFKKNRLWLILVAWTMLLALDLTHHATNFVFEGLFLLWAIIYPFRRSQPLRKSIVIPTSILGIALTATTILVIGNTVIGYFTSFFADISSQIAQDLGSAGSSSRQLFGGGAVIVTPLWERLISLGSVGLITLSIPFLLLCFWRRYRRNSLVWVFAIVITFYPVLQVLRLTTSGAEISDRASAFIFIAISFLGAVAIVQYWPVRSLNWKHSAVISAALLVLFMGGIILGEGIPPTFMPGPYLASADSRSIDAEGIQAALWARDYLGPNNRMYTDRINQLLMSVYGDQYMVTKIGDNIDVTDVIFDPTVSTYEISRLKQGNVHYLAIDMRLSTQLPQDGFYYEQGESTTGPNGDTTAINPERLTKFDTVPQINRLFDSGNIAIYDTGGLINAAPIP